MIRELEAQPKGRRASMPPQTVRLVQITDCHLLADPAERLGGVDTEATLAAVIERVRAEAPPPDAVLATGDLSQDGTAEAYRRIKALFARLDPPVHCLPGNHDDAPTLAEVLPGGGVYVGSSLLLGGWQIVLLDSTVAGQDDGRLDADELARLDRALGDQQGRHALVCLHHQPVAVGGAWRDAVSLENPDELFAVLDRHAHVRGVLWGHVHLPFEGARKGVRLMASPSTCFQFVPGADDSLAVGTDPPAYRRIGLRADGAIETEVCWLDAAAPPRP